MLCSVLYHLFGCISSRVSADFLKLDYCGIGLGILGCYLCGLHLSFECYRDWRIRYETMIIFLMFTAVIYYIHGVKRYITQNIHVTLFITIALLGFLPGFHWYYLHGGWTNQFVQHFFPKLFVLYGILGLGTFAYLIKFPERFFPGIQKNS
jgi:predicted membrane channel-forming protein YqfA (hemolysin III family)